MRLRLIREPSLDGATLGILLIDGHYFSFTLEDEIREQPGEPVEAWKVPGQTAIPAGSYRVTVTWSRTFQRNLPEVRDVPGFSGIRLHSGNDAEDTSGCILIGFRRAHAVVFQSRPAMTALIDRIVAAEVSGEPVTLTIENPS